LSDLNVDGSQVTTTNFYGWVTRGVSSIISAVSDVDATANMFAEIGYFFDCTFNMTQITPDMGGNATDNATAGNTTVEVDMSVSSQSSSSSSEMIDGENGFFYNNVWYSFTPAPSNESSSNTSTGTGSTPAPDTYPAYCSATNKAISKFFGGLATLPTVVTGLDKVVGWLSTMIQSHSNITFDSVGSTQTTISNQLKIVEQQM